jgi:hypothetical protein
MFAPKREHDQLRHRLKALRESTLEVGQMNLQRARRVMREARRNDFMELERLTGILSSSRMPALRTTLLLQARREQLAERLLRR